MANKKRKHKSNKQPMLFSSENYKLLALGALLITIGFVVMYYENEVLGFFSLYVCPIVILAGYGIVLMALLKKSNGSNAEKQTVSS
jgi:hypothetical protein